MKLFVLIALKHLLARKRQSLVSLLGIVLGVSFFLTISSLMQGSEKDFIKRLIDNSPHIIIMDEYRNPRLQPVYQLYEQGAIELRSMKPLTETRGIRGYEQIIHYLRHTFPGIRTSPALVGQALLSYAGKDFSITMNGMIPEEIKTVSTINHYMIAGTIDDLIVNPDGIVIGNQLARKLSLKLGDNITATATSGQVRTFKILGIFRTGRSDFDANQTFVSLKRAQALLNRVNRANSILIKLPMPYQAYELAAEIERQIGYQTVSWQEKSEDLLNTLVIRNTIMYSVVSAVLIVAAFGIYNVISTVVMEKHRDIAILKSMGFYSRDIQLIFIIQGLLLGMTGCLLGLPLGSLLMYGLMQVQFKPPGSSELVSMPLDWGYLQFVIAAAFAMIAAMVAALLPARKAAWVQPVDILRGGT
ncbi:ABC transporter permease [Legionella oakridgensis]|uniref:ABC-type transport system, involved in lipoprotein release, permease component n=2 Tax=Legionella oakridgensis TaxID=29423 RepID=W0B7T9_9GAMM|nr:ABC transporter permease [Legionella oakridgensis]AHE65920.1 ABC-type transport system, involved in lipoprotein release, permease component [Legionella oakridgensis ATCC 33761 = DSM 21215]ETO94295.1 ABC-type transport system, involved in lipoprotein release, permease component [Legionella oakridgensis RV-2-2007]KTD43774.1 ABC transporter permease [Legionella oakridgensis]STY15851.1 ABC transporter permease [Legionella longbeachae]